MSAGDLIRIAWEWHDLACTLAGTVVIYGWLLGIITVTWQ